MITESDAPIGDAVGEKYAPSVLGRLHIVEVGPPLLADGDRRAEVDVLVLKGNGTDRLPPLDEPGLPGLEGPLEATVARQVDVVRDQRGVVDGSHHTRLLS